MTRTTSASFFYVVIRASFVDSFPYWSTFFFDLIYAFIDDSYIFGPLQRFPSLSAGLSRFPHSEQLPFLLPSPIGVRFQQRY